MNLSINPEMYIDILQQKQKIEYHSLVFTQSTIMLLKNSVRLVRVEISLQLVALTSQSSSGETSTLPF